MTTVTLSIASTGYTGIIRGGIRQSISNYARDFDIELVDSDGSKLAAIQQGDDVQITIDGTLVFRGRVEQVHRTETKRLRLEGRDYYYMLISKYAQLLSYSGKTASYILADLVGRYFSGILTTTGIQPTSNTYTREYRLTPIGQVVAELNRAEGFITYVHTDLDVKFEPENYTDSGKHYTSADLLEVKYSQRSDDLINRVVVVYGPSLDKAIERQDDASIALYGAKEQVEVKSSITTEADAIAHADSIITAYSQPTEPVIVRVKLDPTLQAGTIVWLPLAVAGKTELPYLVLEVEHEIAPPSSKLLLGVYTTDTSTALAEIIRKLRRLEEDKISSSVTFTAVNDVFAELGAAVTTTVRRRTISGALWGEFTMGQKRYGQLSGAYSTLLSTAATLTNKGVESLLRIIYQIATVPALYDSGNAHIAVGAGGAVAKITDLMLASEISRLLVDAGHPNAPADGQLVWTSTFGDAEISTLTATEFGLFNASSGGDMLCKTAEASVIKSSDEELEVEFALTLTGLGTVALNLLRDLVAGLDSGYLDAANVAIEVQGSTTYRELVGSIAFVDANYDKVRVEVRLANPGDVPTGSTISTIKLYNKTSGGTEVDSQSVATITTVAGKDNVLRHRLELRRT